MNDEDRMRVVSAYKTYAAMTETVLTVPLVASPTRGRWVAVCWLPGLDGKIQRRGLRCTSKTKARKVAKQYNGVVRRYRTRDWISQPPPKVTVHTWVRKL